MRLKTSLLILSGAIASGVILGRGAGARAATRRLGDEISVVVSSFTEHLEIAVGRFRFDDLSDARRGELIRRMELAEDCIPEGRAACEATHENLAAWRQAAAVIAQAVQHSSAHPEA